MIQVRNEDVDDTSNTRAYFNNLFSCYVSSLTQFSRRLSTFKKKKYIIFTSVISFNMIYFLTLYIFTIFNIFYM